MWGKTVNGLLNLWRIVRTMVRIWFYKPGAIPLVFHLDENVVPDCLYLFPHQGKKSSTPEWLEIDQYIHFLTRVKNHPNQSDWKSIRILRSLLLQSLLKRHFQCRFILRTPADPASNIRQEERKHKIVSINMFVLESWTNFHVFCSVETT